MRRALALRSIARMAIPTHARAYRAGFALYMSRDWKNESEATLTPFEKQVIWEKDTEPPRKGEYDKFYPKVSLSDFYPKIFQNSPVR